MSDYKVEEIRAMLAEATTVLVVTHIGPDGDAIGSLTAMGLALRQLGKVVTMVCDDGVPSRFRFLPLTDDVQKASVPGAQYDMMVAVDCGDMQRMGRAYADLPEPKPPILNIDHHVTNTYFGEVNVVLPEANSTTEVLHELLLALGAQMTPDLARSLLTGIVTDTLGFRTVGVTAHTLSAAAELMRAGADLMGVMMPALIVKPFSTLRMWQKGLNKMKMEDGLLWTSVNNEERKAAGHLSAGSAGLVNMLADIDEVAIGAVLLEYDDGRVYVGLRCRPPFSVAELALNLGGGGHPLAAGATLEMPLAKAESLVVEMAKESIRSQRALLAESHNP